MAIRSFEIQMPFLVEIEDADEGGFVGHVVNVPGAISQGETVAETHSNVRDALRELIEAKWERGKPMPETTINLCDRPQGAAIRIECGPDGVTAVLESPFRHASNRMYQLANGNVVHVDVGHFRYYVQAWREELCDECHELKGQCACAVLVPA